MRVCWSVGGWLKVDSFASLTRPLVGDPCACDPPYPPPHPLMQSFLTLRLLSLGLDYMHAFLDARDACAKLCGEPELSADLLISDALPKVAQLPPPPPCPLPPAPSPYRFPRPRTLAAVLAFRGLKAVSCHCPLQWHMPIRLHPPPRKLRHAPVALCTVVRN